MSNGNTGVTVKKADADELMSAMLEMYDNAELREKFASSSREFVMKKFEQKQLVSHIIEDRKRLMGISK
jgi:glycosyltransferase involved in cell wall biosynthesis